MEKKKFIVPESAHIGEEARTVGSGSTTSLFNGKTEEEIFISSLSIFKKEENEKKKIKNKKISKEEIF